VVTDVLSSTKKVELKGEKRTVTMMMSDLRGFTSMAARLQPERVVALLNRYLSTMIPIIKQYQGTVDEIIGDAIFVLFGVPVWREDNAQRAVACALAMQLAMDSVNEQNRSEDLPEVEMGIGVHSGPVVVGNVGSPERMKYGVVGSHVNLTSRIQSCTTGGQILISDSARREAGPNLKVGKRLEVRAKGIEQPVTLYEALGIARPYQLFLPQDDQPLQSLNRIVPFKWEVVESNYFLGESLSGELTRLSEKRAQVRLEKPVPVLSDIKIDFPKPDERDDGGTLYAKVVGLDPETSEFLIRFTSKSPATDAFFHTLSG
jgi:adenylate cyclase